MNINKDRNKIIATNIKMYISQKKITQKELAEAIGISPTTLSDYMNLRSNPSHGVIQKIADYFGVLKSDIDTTYKDDNTITNDSPIQSIYNQLEPKFQQLLLNEAKAHLKSQNASKVVPLDDKKEKRKHMTLAAHDPEPDREITEEEADKIHDYLDELDAEYDRKNNIDK